jgi:hypothetical protein
MLHKKFDIDLIDSSPTGLLEAYDDLKFEIRELQTKQFEIDERMKRMLIEDGATHCLTINRQRMRSFYQNRK